VKRSIGLVSYVLAAIPLALCFWFVSYGAMWGFSIRSAWLLYALMIGFSFWFIAVGRKLRAAPKAELPE